MGIITEGISGMYGVILIVAAVVSLLEVMKASGAISSLIAWSRKHFAKSPTGSELVMLNTTLWDFLTAGVTTNAVAVCGPINNDLVKF